jgi:predicted RNA binding protein YcfA (HicA-like mRNA interferase family)
VVKGYYRQLAKLLKANGFTYAGNAKGSHEKWRRETDGRLVLVPFNCHSRHTANAILASAGIDRRL